MIVSIIFTFEALLCMLVSMSFTDFIVFNNDHCHIIATIVKVLVKYVCCISRTGIINTWPCIAFVVHLRSLSSRAGT